MCALEELSNMAIDISKSYIFCFDDSTIEDSMWHIILFVILQ